MKTHQKTIKPKPTGRELSKKEMAVDKGIAIFNENNPTSKCEAVLYLEYGLGLGASRARPYLDAIYNHDWIAIAAFEGSF